MMRDESKSALFGVGITITGVVISGLLEYWLRRRWARASEEAIIRLSSEHAETVRVSEELRLRLDVIEGRLRREG